MGIEAEIFRAWSKLRNVMYVQCAVHVRAVVWNGTEERSFGICQGKSGRAQSHDSVWTVSTSMCKFT